MPLSADKFYGLPELKIYKSYPVYAPGKEPADYMDRLKQTEPELAFNPTRLKTDEDWIRAGEVVFDAAVAIRPVEAEGYVTDPTWYREHAVPVAKDETVPFYRYVIREKGKVEVGTLSCGNCHTRVLPDGTVAKGAQGNFPRAHAAAYAIERARSQFGDEIVLNVWRAVLKREFATPWLKDDINSRINFLSLDEIVAANKAMPAGVLACHNSSPVSPVQVPDLIGVKDHKYLDHTGHMLHREIGDMMRFSAFVQGNTTERFGEHKLPVMGPGFVFQERMSDAQLYALARYLYSLQPPPNPNKFGALAARGQKIFDQEGCAACHTPPLYTNNALTPAEGFTPPTDHLTRYAITPTSVGTDPTLALKTRKGTGYYKVPSLKGVWYRGPFEHNGSVARLEDWFDPRRTSDDYVPTGFVGFGLKTRAVKGHPFGLNLTAEERKALIAFLKTL